MGWSSADFKWARNRIKEKEKIKQMSKKKSKFSAIKMVCNQGHNHDSRLEGRYCNKLELLLKAGEIFQYDVQMTFPMEVKGVHICNHIVDFVVVGFTDTGKVRTYPEVHDTKGMRTPVFNLKYKLFKVLYPQIEYKIISGGGECLKKRRKKVQKGLKKL